LATASAFPLDGWYLSGFGISGGFVNDAAGLAPFGDDRLLAPEPALD
jgi:hypothetical protein